MPPAAITIDCPRGSDTGAYRIAWTLGGEPGPVAGAATPRFRLEENGVQLYEGPHLATSVSGRQRGEYAYRVAVLPQDPGAPGRSDSCTVAVEPPSLALALGLFGTGLVVFVATVVLVLLGHRAHRRGENLP